MRYRRVVEIRELERDGRRGEARRARWERIRAAAEELFEETDFALVTTREVARRAGVAEATFFRDVKSKHELLGMVYGDRLDALLNATEEADAELLRTSGPVASSGDVTTRVHRVYRSRCDFYRLSPGNVTHYLRLGFDVDQGLSARPVAQGDRTIRLVASILRDGQQAGVTDDRVGADLVAQNLHGTYMHEIDRTPIRGFDPATIWDRLQPRLDAQLLPLALP